MPILLNIHLYTLYTVGMLTSWSASWCTVPYRTTSLLTVQVHNPRGTSRYFHSLPELGSSHVLILLIKLAELVFHGIETECAKKPPKKGNNPPYYRRVQPRLNSPFSCSPEIHSLYVSIAHLDPQPPFFQTQSRIHSFSSLPP